MRCEEALAVKARQAAQRIKGESQLFGGDAGLLLILQPSPTDVMFRHHPLQVSFVDVTFAHSREAVQASAPGAEIVAAAGCEWAQHATLRAHSNAANIAQRSCGQETGPSQRCSSKVSSKELLPSGQDLISPCDNPLGQSNVPSL